MASLARGESLEPIRRVPKGQGPTRGGVRVWGWEMSSTTHYHKQAETHVWETPQAFFDSLNDEFGFTLDVCALPENAKCQKFFNPVDDGLAQSWAGHVCWMNPPYGREIRAWMKKAYECGSLVVCLVPARTDAGWWHEYAMKGEIRFIRGRLKFSGHKYDAPFPCAVVIFRGGR